MLEVRDLPALNAILNATSATLLVTGFIAIRRKRVALHKTCMLTAFAVSCLFLVSYVTHKALAGHTPFPGSGGAYAAYFAILLSHMILAAATLPLSIVTLRRGLRGEIARHKKLARITWPIWLYVSVTGVVVWWMLYGGAFVPPPT